MAFRLVVADAGRDHTTRCTVLRAVSSIAPVGAENSVTSCCLHVFVDDAAEPVSS